jgi:hypothetical protein
MGPRQFGPQTYSGQRNARLRKLPGLHAEQIPLAVVPIIAIGADQGDQTCHETFQDK